MKILLFFFSLLTAFQGRDSIPSDNVKLVQFAQTNSTSCARLQNGKCSATTFSGSRAYLCASYADRISDTWRQELYNDGSLEFEIIWKFETVKTLRQRFLAAERTGERVHWTVKLKNSTVTQDGTWHFSPNYSVWGSRNDQISSVASYPMPREFYGILSVLLMDDMCKILYKNGSAEGSETILNKMYMEEYRTPAPTTTIATVTDEDATTTALASLPIRTHWLNTTDAPAPTTTATLANTTETPTPTPFPAGLGVADLTCSETGFSLTGNARSYPEYVPSDILVGLCVLGPGFFLQMTNYSVCGATKIVHGRNITYSGTIKNKPPTSVITRKKSINYIWECSFDTESNKTASAKIRPIVGQLTGSISKHNGPIDVQLNLLDLTGAVIQEGGTLALKVNSQVTATVTGKNLDHMGLNVYATNCHTTPSNNPKDPISYTLLENGCPRDPTFKIATYGRGQRMTFRAFAFSSNTSAAVYLHCKLIKCKVNAGCGKCHLSHRRRRSLRQYTGTKRKTGVMTMGSAKIQVY